MADFLYLDLETNERKAIMNDVGYTQKHIDKCEQILNEYIDDLISLKIKSDKNILKCVKKVIGRLNKLNKECNYSLIETNQRESLVPYILEASKISGLNINADVTEEWREW